MLWLPRAQTLRAAEALNGGTLLQDQDRQLVLWAKDYLTQIEQVRILSHPAAPSCRLSVWCHGRRRRRAHSSLMCRCTCELWLQDRKAVREKFRAHAELVRKQALAATLIQLTWRERRLRIQIAHEQHARNRQAQGAWVRASRTVQVSFCNSLHAMAAGQLQLQCTRSSGCAIEA